MVTARHLEDPARKVSPKVVWSTLGSLLAGLAIAVLGALTTPEGQEMLGRLPDVVSWLLLLCVPTLITFLAGYVKRDPLRDDGAVLQMRESQARRAADLERGPNSSRF